jgi:CheY-like chemotaxis protein
MAISRSESTSISASILLIDDNAMGLAARKVVLEELGHRITTAGTPRDAMSCLSTQKFDLVITDFRMPEMTGAELIRWMREQGIACPVILISGFVDTLGLNENNTGADLVIQKSSHEVSHMVRGVKSLLRPRKPAGSSLLNSKRQRKATL